MLKTLLNNIRLKCNKWVSLFRGTAIVYINESIVSKHYGELSNISCSSKSRSIFHCNIRDYLMLRNSCSAEWHQTFNEYHLESRNGIAYIYVELKCVDMNVFA